MSTQIHVGLSGRFLRSACLSEGQRSDMKAFTELWIKGNGRKVIYIIADKGVDFFDVRKLIRDSGKSPVIPRRKGAVCTGIQPNDKEKYKTRSAIERFFFSIKEQKRLALGFDKLDITFFSFFAIACLKVFNLLC
ncbi:hypothetical protein [Candidatus Williamhamiltonella defendens]|nr:hypothetical protein [Candidatus Hamiltonella defensa]